MIHGSNFTTPYKHVHEAIWLPTYAVVVLVVLGTVQNSNAASFVMIASLIACRMLLEFVYRLVFGDERLTVRIGLLALVSQLVIFGGVLAWYFHSSQNI